MGAEEFGPKGMVSPKKQFWGNEEFRAVFASPHDASIEKGPARDTMEEVLKDRPMRSEETHRYLAGVEVRGVSPWRAVPLDELMENKS